MDPRSQYPGRIFDPADRQIIVENCKLYLCEGENENISFATCRNLKSKTWMVLVFWAKNPSHQSLLSAEAASWDNAWWDLLVQSADLAFTRRYTHKAVYGGRGIKVTRGEEHSCVAGADSSFPSKVYDDNLPLYPSSRPKVTKVTNSGAAKETGDEDESCLGGPPSVIKAYGHEHDRERERSFLGDPCLRVNQHSRPLFGSGSPPQVAEVCDEGAVEETRDAEKSCLGGGYSFAFKPNEHKRSLSSTVSPPKGKKDEGEAKKTISETEITLLRSLNYDGATCDYDDKVSVSSSDTGFVSNTPSTTSTATMPPGCIGLAAAAKPFTLFPSVPRSNTSPVGSSGARFQEAASWGPRPETPEAHLHPPPPGVRRPDHDAMSKAHPEILFTFKSETFGKHYFVETCNPSGNLKKQAYMIILKRVEKFIKGVKPVPSADDIRRMALETVRIKANGKKYFVGRDVSDLSALPPGTADKLQEVKFKVVLPEN
ncbi:hypothetical protein QQS21_008527 [Conoideocrella luteorostrata]|uniref:Uncharacterized protein n=1 Tax=Conoideocrella luteorostrata TaxID=1105319 RepID=A0AAJ0CN50_9HYPO|nr:hypothetical protein QQS21_008527 [Conoideocrella luteorostrata]